MNTVDWSKVKIHCSALYNIMASSKKKSNMQIWEEACIEIVKKRDSFEKLKKKDGPRGEKLEEAMDKLEMLIPILESQKDIEEPLSEGCKTLLTGVYSSEKYGKWSPNKDIGSRQTEKGKEVEDDSLSLVGRLDKKFLIKNEERVENDWFSGHPDAFEGDNILNARIIHDVKSPWDIETFFSYLGKPLPQLYYWQMQGYLDLTGASVAEVHFCLVDTPERFIKDAATFLLRNRNFISDLSPDYLLAEAEIFNNMTFSDIPMAERRIKFIVERNEEDILKARKKVEKCREHLISFEKMHMTGEVSENLVPLMQSDAE